MEFFFEPEDEFFSPRSRDTGSPFNSDFPMEDLPFDDFLDDPSAVDSHSFADDGELALPDSFESVTPASPDAQVTTSPDAQVTTKVSSPPASQTVPTSDTQAQTTSAASKADAPSDEKHDIDMALLKSQTVVRAADNAQVAMASIMSGPVLLHVIRRYGCAICRDHARELSLLKRTLDNYGVRMVAVGRGERGIEKWKKAGYWKGELYFETEDAKVSEALSLTQTGNVLGLFDHKVLSAVLKTGVGDMSLSGGDYWNLAGTFVFSKEGETLYELRQKSFADAPGIEELMQACRRAAGY